METNIVPSNSLPDDPHRENADKILKALIEEFNRRLNDPRELRKFRNIPFTELLTHIERMLLSLKKSTPHVTLEKHDHWHGELQRAQERIKQIESHPARRKELRAEVRKLNHIPG